MPAVEVLCTDSHEQLCPVAVLGEKEQIMED